jgi:hypothetical protein
MKKGVLFIAMTGAFLISFVLLLNLGARVNAWTFWIALVLLPLSGFIAAKTDFRTDD